MEFTIAGGYKNNSLIDGDFVLNIQSVKICKKQAG